jgi:hypothetical protein
MNALSWSWRLVCAASVVLGVCLPGPSRADDKDKKDAGKGKDTKKVIVIQLDPSKVPPDVLKKLLELSKTKAKAKKGDDDDEKRGKGKARL